MLHVVIGLDQKKKRIEALLLACPSDMLYKQQPINVNRQLTEGPLPSVVGNSVYRQRFVD
jgi:hypothetical protein